MRFLITGLEGENGWYSSETELIAQLERIVTSENYKTIKVITFDDMNLYIRSYSIGEGGACLFTFSETDDVNKILTPGIKQKLDNSPQNVQENKSHKYLLCKGNIPQCNFDTVDQLIKELEKVVTRENIRTINVVVYHEIEGIPYPRCYGFNHYGTCLHAEHEKEILTPTIKQKLDAELKNNPPQNVQPAKLWKYLLIKDDKVIGDFVSLDYTLKELEKVVTRENIKTINVFGRVDTACPKNYYLSHDGSRLHSDKDPYGDVIPTPGIKQKLDAESKKNPPQNVQTYTTNEKPQQQNVEPIKTNEKPQPKNYLLIKDNYVKEKSFDDLKKEVSQMSLDEIEKTTIYDLGAKVSFKYSLQKLLFEMNEGVTFSDELTKHLTCTYKMLILSAEDPNEPFELTKKCICEKKVLILNDEYIEMSKYRKDQLVESGGEFKVDGLFKGHLVRIFLIKNNAIIGEINERGIFYKTNFKGRIASGEFMKCHEAMKSYIDYVNEFRKKPLEEIRKIYLGMIKHDLFTLFDDHPAIISKKNNVDEMIDFMIKTNELVMLLINFTS
jgi:hypothetical protein